jgi:hypothetical protein
VRALDDPSVANRLSKTDPTTLAVEFVFLLCGLA